jgi:hypothetical protein
VPPFLTFCSRGFLQRTEVSKQSIGTPCDIRGGDAQALSDSGPHRPSQSPPRSRRQRGSRSHQGLSPGASVDGVVETPVRPTCCPRRCASSIPPPWSLLMIWAAPMPLEVLRIATHRPSGRDLARSNIASALRWGGRQRRSERAAEVQSAWRSEQLEARPSPWRAPWRVGQRQTGRCRRDDGPKRSARRGALLGF